MKVDCSSVVDGCDSFVVFFEVFGMCYFDFVQLYNLCGVEMVLLMFYEQQVVGYIGYVGIISLSDWQYVDMEVIMWCEWFDFIQVDYVFGNWSVEKWLLLLVVDCGMVVLVNLLFGCGEQFCVVGDWLLLIWVVDIDCCFWVQFFFKYVVFYFVVICVIFGSMQVVYVEDNFGVVCGWLLDMWM